MNTFLKKIPIIAITLRLIKKIVKKIVIYRTLNLGLYKYKDIRFWYFPRLYKNKQQYAEWLEPVLIEIFKYRAGAFIDVGANMGQTLQKVLSIDNQRDYIGFEPNVLCCFYVQQFIKMNELHRCRILPLGLSNKFGVAKLLMPLIDSAATLIKGFRPDSFYSDWQYVSIVTGDSLMPNLGLSSLSIIKIDVEGGELEVIEGLRTTIAKYKPFIIFEVLPHYLAITDKHLDANTIEFRTGRIRQLENILKEEGYAIFQIYPGKILKKIDRFNPGTEPDLSKVDYLAIPCNEENDFLSLSNFKKD